MLTSGRKTVFAFAHPDLSGHLDDGSVIQKGKAVRMTVHLGHIEASAAIQAGR